MVNETTVPYRLLEQQNNNNYLFKISFRLIPIFAVLFPLTAFFFCVFWSVYYDFEGSTSTHCDDAKNYLPSISAAIGNTQTQTYVWNLSIALHSFPRFFMLFVYHTFYGQYLVPRQRISILAAFATLLSFTENVSLVGLSFFSSRNHYPIHEKCFITFLIVSELYMLLTIKLMKSLKDVYMTPRILQSLKLKKRLVTLNMVATASAAFFFYRHNWYCESGIYTLFALSEYIVVLSNMGYHSTAYYDFYDKTLYVGRSYVVKIVVGIIIAIFFGYLAYLPHYKHDLIHDSSERMNNTVFQL